MVGIVFYQKENKRWAGRWGSVQVPQQERSRRWHVTAPRGDKRLCRCSQCDDKGFGSLELVSPTRSSI